MRLVTILATRQEIDLSTSFDYPPIPIRSQDWSAVNDRTYDLGGLAGHGRTELAAIYDLFDQLEEQ